MKILVWLLVLFIGLGSQAWALRCLSGRIVNVGDSKSQVLSYCGEPRMIIDDGVTGSYTARKKRGSYREKPVEIWVLGTSQVVGSLEYRLTFEGDTLVNIQHVPK